MISRFPVSTALDHDEQRSERREESRSRLPTAPRSALSALPVERWRLPEAPPYTAFLGNLPYDVSEDSIRDFFSGLAVASVRLPRDPGTAGDGGGGRLKGFGYAQFHDRDSLARALELNESPLGSRKVRVDLAEQPSNDNGNNGFPPARGRDRAGGGGGDMSDASDWRAPRPSAGGAADGNTNSGGGTIYHHHNRYEPSGRDGGGRSFHSRSGGGGGGGVFGNGSWRNYDDKPGSYGRYERRYGDNGGGFRREERGSGGTAPSAAQRPKLNLKPCSLPPKEQQQEDGSNASAEPGTPSSSRASAIFGGARPVDTAARERQMEERLQKQQQDAEGGGGGRRPPRDRDHPPRERDQRPRD